MENSRPHTVPKYVVYSFFLLGLVSAIAFRAIIVLQHLEPVLGEACMVYRHSRICPFFSFTATI